MTPTLLPQMYAQNAHVLLFVRQWVAVWVVVVVGSSGSRSSSGSGGSRGSSGSRGSNGSSFSTG